MSAAAKSTMGASAGARVHWRADVTYRKTGRLRYLGHLDLARGIERALRRASLPVSYSEGFNQRMRLSFGPPLPVGAEGEAEMLAVTLDQKITDDDFARRLGAQLPGELGLVSARVSPSAAPSPLSAVRYASWRMVLAGEPAISREDLASACCRALSSSHLEVEPTKAGKSPLDARPRITHLEVAPAGEGAELWALVGASGDNYLAPDKLLRALEPLLPVPARLRWTRLVRTGLHPG